MRSKKTLPRALSFAGLAAAACLGLIYYQNSRVPQLGVDEGLFKALRNTPNGVSTQSNKPEKRVEPLEGKETTEATMAALKQSVESVGGGKIVAQREDYLYVVFTTPLMKFHDDAEFWLDSEKNLVHFRSEARAGYSDMGINRKRYQKIREHFNKV